jgi:hypothetical protein
LGKYDDRPIAQSTDEWLAASIAQAVRNLEYARESHAEEVERTNSRNAWLKALRDSVPMPK